MVYFYFGFDDFMCQNLSTFLKSALEQLCYREKVLALVEALHQQYCPGPPSLQALKTRFFTAIELLCAGEEEPDSTDSTVSIGSTEPLEETVVSGATYLVLDGIDEIPYGPECEMVIQFLSQLAAHQHRRLHILVFSRPEWDIETSVVLSSSWTALRITSADIEPDVKTYVVNQIGLNHKLRKQPEHVKDDIVKKLVYGSGGMFRWTALQMQELNSRRIMRRKESTSILSSLPIDLDSTYERILAKVDSNFVDEAAAALRWLVSASRPLFVEELAEACIIRVEDPCPFDRENRLSPLDILDLLPGLIKVEPAPDPSIDLRLRFHTVSLAHFSVKEYLLGQRICSGPLKIFGVDAKLAHSYIARCCLAYISCCNDVVLSLKIDDPADSLRPYAFSEWTHHASMTPQDLLRDVSAQALEVFRNPETCLTMNAITNLVQRTKSGGFRSQLSIPFNSYKTTDWPRYYMLLYAIRLQNLTMVKLLLEQGLDLSSNARTDDFLVLALDSQQLDIAELLLDNGYEPGRSELLLGMTHATPHILTAFVDLIFWFLNMSTTATDGGAKQLPLGAVDDATMATITDDEKALNGRGNPSADAAAPAGNGPSNVQPPRSTIQIFLLMTAACMSVFLAALDMTIITTALPTIAEHFGSSAGFAWVGSAFMLAAAASTANWGKFSDVWGRKPVLLAASAVFFLGCALCGAATSLAMLIAGRAVQGVGAGGLLTLVNIIIGDIFSARERGKYYGMIGMVWATASALGPIVGGALTNNVSWRWCFYINLPISGTAFFIILFTLHLPTPHTPLLAGLRSIDWLGSLLITGGTLMLLMGLQYGGNAYPWRSVTVICLIVFGVVTLVLFGLVEHRLAVYPLLPTHLFASRSNVAVLCVCLFHGLAFTQAIYFLPTYFQAVLGATPLLSGVYLLPVCLPVSLCAAGSGIYLKRTGRFRDPIILGLLLAVLGSGLLLNLPRGRNVPSTSSAWARIVIYQGITGAGIGLNFQPPLVALQSNVPPQNNASATAFFSLTRNMASAIAVVAASAAFANRMTAQRPAILAAAAGNASLADMLSGDAAQANLLLVDRLPPDLRSVVRAAMYDAVRPVWIQTTCFAAAGLIACLFIHAKPLQSVHETVNTGIEGEKERRRIALEQRAHRKATRGEPQVRGNGPAKEAAEV
ncbi:major facilitator superfamily transporter [Grosmannia clavigera kw1407]|uniref:Major facilitator superfamily transporter n=1 Tax=Grosmannia clavigera (strain kw1407 / UAMH 11150) TaxID=655863 RepID=F0XJT8_GROCL|nr:major facilitator superfamily transporter [Grosmannia clavigera kw1407]EFX02179.1 major facilitator superfamily transporter [Grosmannia clavigera kw1407]